MALKGAQDAKAAVDAETIAGRQASHQVKRLHQIILQQSFVNCF